MSDVVKIPPHSKDSEMMVLGCMLASVNSLNIAADGLEESDFYFNEHRLVFRALKAAYKQEKPADIHLIAEELKRLNLLDAVGGVAYLTTLAQFAGTAVYIEHYVELVKAKSLLRKMIQAAGEIEKKAFDEPEDVQIALDEAQQKFFAISQATGGQGFVTIKDILSGSKASSKTPFLKELEERQELFLTQGEEAVSVTGMPSHFIDLDKMINGLGPSNLMILAARPAMGKTAFAVNIAENACFKSNCAVGIFSLEMTAEQLLHRIVCSQAEVESDKIKKGKISGHEYQRIVAAINMMCQKTMVIDDQPGLRISDLRARARRMKESYNIDLLIVDYLQLISGSGYARSNDNRQTEISEISRMLKNLARELDIPIICLSQLSRKVEERPGHRPMMSDLRESGSIEQDADVVLFLLRPEYYDPYDKPGMAEVIVAKNRHGSVGSVNLTFRKEIAQFCNYSPAAAAASMDEDPFASMRKG